MLRTKEHIPWLCLQQGWLFTSEIALFKTCFIGKSQLLVFNFGNVTLFHSAQMNGVSLWCITPDKNGSNSCIICNPHRNHSIFKASQMTYQYNARCDECHFMLNMDEFLCLPNLFLGMQWPSFELLAKREQH